MAALTPSRVVAGAGLALVAALNVGHPANADAPTSVPALGAEPDSVAPGGTIVLRGSDCVGSGGIPGVANVVITMPGGVAASSTISTVDANGSWVLSLSAGATPGQVAIAATCDIYGQSIPYPATTVSVTATGQSAPAAPPDSPIDPSSTPTAPPPMPAPDASTDGQSTSAPSTETATTTPAADGDLPLSGFAISGLALAAFALLGTGFAAVLAGRRPRK